MTNPFSQEPQYKFETFTDAPDKRVMLECQECGIIVFEGKYHRPTRILTWKCDRGHVSHQEIDL